MPGSTLPQEIRDQLYGRHQSNQALSTAEREGLFNLKGDRPLPERQNADGFNVVRVTNGGVHSQVRETYRLSTDAAQSASTAELETARLGVYRSGVENEVGIGVWVEDRPTGDGEIRMGYGDNTTENGVYHVITSDDWLVTFESSFQPDVDVSRAAGEWDRGEVTEKTDGNGNVIGRVYGLNPPGSENDPVSTWDPGVGYVYGLTLGWYGPLSTMAWVDIIGNSVGEWAQRRVPLFLYRPLGAEAWDTPNRPIHVSVDNGATAEQVQVRVGGRQYSVQGRVQPTPDPTWASATGMSLPMDGTGVGPKDWYPVAVMRRKQGFDGAAVGLEEIEVSAANESLALHARVVDSQYITGTSYEGPDDVDATATSLEFDIKSDTSTRVEVDTWTDPNDGDKVKPQGYGWRGDHVGAGAKNTATSGDLSGDLRFPFVRDVPTVFFARTRSDTSDTVDVIAKLQEVGA